MTIKPKSGNLRTILRPEVPYHTKVYTEASSTRRRSNVPSSHAKASQVNSYPRGIGSLRIDGTVDKEAQSTGR